MASDGNGLEVKECVGSIWFWSHWRCRPELLDVAERALPLKDTSSCVNLGAAWIA